MVRQALQEALKTREGIKWIAMDNRGAWFCSEVEPVKTVWTWEPQPNTWLYDLSCLNMPKVPKENWRDTLIKVRD